MAWHQHRLTLPAYRRGFHIITRQVVEALPELASIRVGLLHVFIQHTSASVSINENADPDVPRDLESSFNAIAPEDFPYVHTCEGPDDMPAHVKSAYSATRSRSPFPTDGFASGHGRESISANTATTAANAR